MASVSAVVAQEKGEHKEILATFNILKHYLECDSGSSGICTYMDDEAILASLKNMMVLLDSHLKFEDKDLYGKLDKVENEEVRSTSKKFHDDMLGISHQFYDFLKKYSGISATKLKADRGFKENLKKIIDVVGRRIVLEEEIFFPMYERFCKD